VDLVCGVAFRSSRAGEAKASNVAEEKLRLANDDVKFENMTKPQQRLPMDLHTK
jgi:hypothetical protein